MGLRTKPICAILFDYIVMLIVGIGYWVIKNYMEINSQCVPGLVSNTCNIQEPSPLLGYPYIKFDVPLFYVYLFGATTWSTVIFISVVCLRPRLSSTIIRILFIHVESMVRELLTSVIITKTTVLWMQKYVGRPRPNFYKYYEINPNNSVQSFPSEHASLSFCIHILLTYHVGSAMITTHASHHNYTRMRAITGFDNIHSLFGAKLWQNTRCFSGFNVFIILLLLALPIWISCTQIRDYYNSYSDVIGGALLGITVASITFIIYKNELYPKKAAISKTYVNQLIGADYSSYKIMDSELLPKKSISLLTRKSETKDKDAKESKYDVNEEKIILSNVLIVNICIEVYEGDENNKYKAADFKYAHYDKQNMIDIFVKNYKYDMLCNKNKNCTRSELDEIIRCAQHQFSDDRNQYQCIIVIYSGHGTQDTLICSDIKSTRSIGDNKVYQYEQKKRIDFVKSFNGDNGVKQQSSNACLDDSKTLHPDANTAIFSPNTDGFQSYSEPNKGGIIISALYETLNENKNNDKSFEDIEESLRSKIDNRNIEVLNVDKNGKEYITVHPVLLDLQYPGLSPRQRRNIYFAKNNIAKSKRQFQKYCKRNKNDLLHQNIDFK
eukprot:12329_1